MGTFYIATLIFSGLICAKILNRLKFPTVTGYLIAGIFIGPSLLNFINHEAIESMKIINDIALGFIAFEIGAEMNVSELRGIGKKIVFVTLFQAILASIFVYILFANIFMCGRGFSFIIASIASATAPAATLMVIKQYKAKGRMVDLLLPVVALDDAACIIIYSIFAPIGIALINGLHPHISNMILEPAIEISVSLLLGLVCAFVFMVVTKNIVAESTLHAFIIASILGTSYMSKVLHASDLLTIMTMSLIIINIEPHQKKELHIVEKFGNIIYICFFVLSGAELQLSSLSTIGLIGLGYIIVRAFGKYIGSYISLAIAKEDKIMQKHFGLALIPQAGVAIGLMQLAARNLPPKEALMLKSVILSATIIYELIGPLMSKYALKKTNCIEEI